MARSYESPLRREQAERTRRALLDACEQVLLAGAPEDVTLHRIAKQAGVTPPTAYRHFPTQEALMSAYLDHVRDRIGMGLAALRAVPAERVHDLPTANYASYEANGTLLRKLMDSPGYERVRLARKVDRAAEAMPAWTAAGERMSEDELRLALAPIYLLVTPAAWRWLRDTWGLSAADAARAAAWAVRTLADAVSAGSAPRDRLAPGDGRTRATKRGKEKR